MKAQIPNLGDDQRISDITERLAELKRQHAEAEAHLRELRATSHDRTSFAKRAEDLADGIEHPAEDGTIEERIPQAAERVELLAAAIGTQTRRLLEARETIGSELLDDLRPAYGKVAGDVAAKVEALCKSLAAHEEFCQAVLAAGLPVSDALPAGGHWRKPQILRYFGSSVTEENSLAKEFFDVLAECGHTPTKSPGKEAARVA